MVVMIDYVVKILLKEKKKSKRTSFTLPIAGILKNLTIAVISTLLRVVGQIMVKIFLFFFLLYSTIKSLTVSYSLSITSCNT